MAEKFLPVWQKTITPNATSGHDLVSFTLHLTGRIQASLFTLRSRTNDRNQDWNYKLSMDGLVLKTYQFHGHLTEEQAVLEATRQTNEFLEKAYTELGIALSGALAIQVQKEEVTAHA